MALSRLLVERRVRMVGAVLIALCLTVIGWVAYDEYRYARWRRAGKKTWQE